MSENDLGRLARLHGILPRHTDATGQEHIVQPETERALLAALGVPASTPAEATDSLRRERIYRWSQLLAPATVVTQGGEMRAPLRGRQAGSGTRVRWWLSLEDGESCRGEHLWPELAVLAQDEIEGAQVEERALPLPADLPSGYHRLQVELTGEGATAAMTKGRLIVMPSRCHLPDFGERPLPWAAAVQLYGLCSSQSWGIGDFGDLARFARVAAGFGADSVALSPLHALFPADPGHYGPYGPSSRLFLNVMHIDVTAVPGFAESEEVRRRCAEPGIQGPLETARRDELVDYRAAAAAKMPVLDVLWDWFRNVSAADPSYGPAAEFARFKAEAGEALDGHALFDALHEHFFRSDPGKWDWRTWPEPFRSRDGAAAAEFEREHVERVDFFRYLQWLADRQLGQAHRDALDAGMSIGLYRDLAIGTHPGGAMAWLHPESIVTGATVGAPPDAFNQHGQNWGIAAISPGGLRATGFSPYVSMLRANMRHAGLLRIDHVMGIERLYWIPAGGRPTDGAYVIYPTEAMRGLLCLESQRNGCAVIGEDLGTVPEGFRDRLADAGVLTYKLLYFEREEDGRFRAPSSYPADSLAAATTHDLPSLAGFWHGRDLAWRDRLGLFKSEQHRHKAVEDRAADRRALLDLLLARGLLPAGSEESAVDIAALIEAVYAALAEAPSMLLVAQAEDLLCLEEQPNLPGTFEEHPNWRRKLPVPIEELGRLPVLNAIAEAIRSRRARRT